MCNVICVYTVMLVKLHGLFRDNLTLHWHTSSALWQAVSAWQARGGNYHYLFVPNTNVQVF